MSGNEFFNYYHTNQFPILFEYLFANLPEDKRLEALKIKNAGADAVVALLYPGQELDLLKQMRNLKVSVPVFGVVGNEDESFLKLAGKSAEGLYIPTYPSGTPDFVRRFQKRWGSPPWLCADTAYDALMLVRQGAALSRSRTGSAIYNSLRGIRDFPGASGVFNLTESGDRESRPSRLLVVRNGAPEEVWLKRE